MEDIKKTESTQEKTEKTKAEVAVVTDSDTPQGAYVHKFQKPYTYEDKTYTELVFDFEKLIGDDLVAIKWFKRNSLLLSRATYTGLDFWLSRTIGELNSWIGEYNELVKEEKK